MLSSPDTLQVLLTGFAELVKLTKHTGLWDAELAWYPPSVTHWICRAREVDETHWTVRSRGRLILSKCYSLDLPWSWRWQTTLNCEMPSLPDTLRELLAGFAKVVKMTNHTELWDSELAWYSRRATRWICFKGFEHGLGVHCFSSTWTFPITEILTTRAKFLEPSGYCVVINCPFNFRIKNVFLVASMRL